MTDKAARLRAAQRRSPRVTVDLAGTLGARQPRPVQVLDVSLGGCLVRCDAHYDRGAVLDLSLGIGPEPLSGKVRVTDAYLDGDSAPEASQYLCGLEFLGLPPREQTRLRRFLDDARRRRRGTDTAAR